MKKWGIRRTQMYDLLKNKKELEIKLTESPVRSAKRVRGNLKEILVTPEVTMRTTSMTLQ